MRKQKRFTPEQSQEFYRIDLTYSPNAIEGNTLELAKTKVVIEDGLANKRSFRNFRSLFSFQ